MAGPRLAPVGSPSTSTGLSTGLSRRLERSERTYQARAIRPQIIIGWPFDELRDPVGSPSLSRRLERSERSNAGRRGLELGQVVRERRLHVLARRLRRHRAVAIAVQEGQTVARAGAVNAPMIKAAIHAVEVDAEGGLVGFEECE